MRKKMSSDSFIEYHGPITWPIAAMVIAAFMAFAAMCTGGRCDVNINVGHPHDAGVSE